VLKGNTGVFAQGAILGQKRGVSSTHFAAQMVIGATKPALVALMR
jgi:hypothetical protein